MLHYDSLNANSLVKTPSNPLQKEYIRYLRLQQYSIVCFQETQVCHPDQGERLNLLFQCTQSFWTSKIGIVAFSENLQLSLIDTSSFFDSERIQLLRIEHIYISLINCDGETLTRILTQRLGSILAKIINTDQKGFLQGRFIGDNGLLVHLILQQSRFHKTEGVGLLLDQEKAYDRVYPLYLFKVMDKLAFPPAVIHCIGKLFFDNR
ncbi:hypothetical protein A0J61_11163, partial [Choanephora cucurbitarum]